MRSVTSGLQTTEPPGLHFEPPSLLYERPRPSMALFEPLKLPVERSVFPGMLNLLFFLPYRTKYSWES
jgi:hypothetical protein